MALINNAMEFLEKARKVLVLMLIRMDLVDELRFENSKYNLFGKDVFTMLYEEDRESMKNFLQSLVNKTGYESAECRLVNKAGEIIRVIITAEIAGYKRGRFMPILLL